MIALLIWLVSAATPRFLGFLVWGDRLRLSEAQWRAIGRSLSIAFAVLGTLNLAFWKLASADAWLNFYVFAPVPLVVATLALVTIAIRRAKRAP